VQVLGVGQSLACPLGLVVCEGNQDLGTEVRWGVSAYLPEHYPEREGGEKDGDEAVMRRVGLLCLYEKPGLMYLGRLPYQNLLVLCSGMSMRI